MCDPPIVIIQISVAISNHQVWTKAGLMKNFKTILRKSAAIKNHLALFGYF